MSESGNDTARKGRPRDAATGHDFALTTLSEVRQRTINLMEALDGSENVARNAIFLPPSANGQNSIHGRAHAALLTYADELTKPTYLIRANAQQFYVEEYTEAEIPKQLAENGEITVTVDDPRTEVDPASYPLEMTGWPITLENLEWWSMRFITIRKDVDSPYWNDGTHTERRKVVLPPRIIRESFRRLESLAAELGVLLQISQGSPHDRT